MGGLGTVSNRVIYADVIVDENSSYTPVAAADVDVVLIRTIKANSWNTIVLPFAMTEEQIEATFGDDAQVAQLTGFSGNTLHFTTVTEMNANEPYMIKVGTAFLNATINDVTIVEGTPSKTNFCCSYGNKRIARNNEDRDYCVSIRQKMGKSIVHSKILSIFTASN